MRWHLGAAFLVACSAFDAAPATPGAPTNDAGGSTPGADSGADGAIAPVALSPCLPPALWTFCDDFDESKQIADTLTKWGGAHESATDFMLGLSTQSPPNAFTVQTSKKSARLHRNITIVTAASRVRFRFDARLRTPIRTQLLSLDMVDTADKFLRSVVVGVHDENNAIELRGVTPTGEVATGHVIGLDTWHSFVGEVTGARTTLIVDNGSEFATDGLDLKTAVKRMELIIGVGTPASPDAPVVMDFDNVAYTIE